MELIKEKVWIKDGRPVREALNDHGRDLTLAYQILKSHDHPCSTCIGTKGISCAICTDKLS